VLGAEALPGDLDEVGAVGQAIEGGRGQQRLAEQLGPRLSDASLECTSPKPFTRLPSRIHF